MLSAAVVIGALRGKISNSITDKKSNNTENKIIVIDNKTNINYI